MTSVLVAPDKFKGSLTASEVSEAVRTGVRRARPDIDVVGVPVADGGDGTLAAALASGFTRMPVTATGPTGERVHTAYARRDGLAVVELADVSGLGRLPGERSSPMRATSRGTGEVISAALDAGCREIILGVGGSACTDGGAGLLQAFGARLLDADGQDLGNGGGSLPGLATIDLTLLRERLAGVSVTVACDVDNPLTGDHGAAAVYGRQKGASSKQTATLDLALAHWADVVAEATGADWRTRPGSGAAGGVAFAAMAVLGASLRPGIDLVLDLVGFNGHLAAASLVVTGEGTLDEQTLRGKAPAGVAAAAGHTRTPVVAVCGRNRLGPETLNAAGISGAYALADIEPSETRCMQQAASLLQRLGEQIATEHL